MGTRARREAKEKPRRDECRLEHVGVRFEDLVPNVAMDVLDVVLLDPHWYGGISGQNRQASG